MNTNGLTYEQNAVVNAVLTLINSMDDKMREALIRKIERKKSTAKPKAVRTSTKHAWRDIPIADDVMAMTFSNRRPIGNYKETLEKELREKYK